MSLKEIRREKERRLGLYRRMSGSWERNVNKGFEEEGSFSINLLMVTEVLVACRHVLLNLFSVQFHLT